MLTKEKERLLIKCPLKIKIGERGRRLYRINFNEVNNLHFQTYNNLKKSFKSNIESQLKKGLVIETPVTVTYKLYKESARKSDKMNFISITSKFLLDALVELGVIEDDNDDFIKDEIILPTEIDRENPRVEVIIKTIK